MVAGRTAGTGTGACTTTGAAATGAGEGAGAGVNAGGGVVSCGCGVLYSPTAGTAGACSLSLSGTPYSPRCSCAEGGAAFSSGASATVATTLSAVTGGMAATETGALAIGRTGAAGITGVTGAECSTATGSVGVFIAAKNDTTADWAALLVMGGGASAACDVRMKSPTADAAALGSAMGVAGVAGCTGTAAGAVCCCAVGRVQVVWPAVS